MYFQYANVRPFLEEFRAKNSLPGLFVSLQKLVEGSEKGRARFRVLLCLPHVRLAEGFGGSLSAMAILDWHPPIGDNPLASHTPITE